MQNKNQTDKQSNNVFPEMEKQVLSFWDKARTFQKSVEKQAPNGSYVFYDGPPFATGMPHYGHIVANVMKDVVPRYYTMKGYKVERRWGWDCHGLPVENLAEKELGLKNKNDIEKMGIEKFNSYCRSIVMRYADEWKKIVKRIGRWVDMENDYKTMDANYMESIWWVFKQLWDKGLIYEGHKAMHICPRCETTLSNFEVTQNYKDITDLSAIAKFELVNEPNTYILAWTTTPWTLIGNVALAINKDIDYVIVKIENENYILAREQLSPKGRELLPRELLSERSDGKRSDLEECFKEQPYEIIKELKGNDLIGLEYKPLFDYYSKKQDLENKENGWKIYDADFVNTEEGTGIVHIAPAFGEDDMELGKKYNLPFIQHIDFSGKIKDEIKDFAGLEVKPKQNPQETDKKITDYLKNQNKLFSEQQYEHSYPHCWRCDTALLNYATNSWFVKVTDFKDNLVKNNQDINWIPEHIKDGRFGKWLEQARDWAISRNRYWGSPLPVWKCSNKECDNIKVIGSIEELEKLSGQKNKDLHRPDIDEIKFKCEKCGEIMERIPDVLDCWFESGSMPYAQEHYPFENKEKFEKNFPANFIAEGSDQTRGWFYVLHILATALEIKGKTSPAFKNVIVNGIVTAEDGRKMSKRFKNYPDPAELFEKYSVDALRYYLLSSPVLIAENLNFSENGVKDVLKKVEMILWNVYKFYAMYADENLELKNSQNFENENSNVLDKWIIYRLNELIKETTENMEKYNLPKATRPIEGFINDLSTWYLRRSRARFKSENEAEKKMALGTMGFVLLELSKIMAPFMPFISEQIWQKITQNNFQNMDKSVHLEKWPVFDDVGDKDILIKMELIRKIVEMGLSERDKNKISLTQPLSKLKIKLKNKETTISDEYIELIKDEINIKQAEICFDSSIQDDIEVELDIELTTELRQEGIKRKVIRLINAMRKQAKMTIQDRAVLYFEIDDEEIKNAIEKYKKDILKDTLSDDIIQTINDSNDFKKEVQINEKKFSLAISKK